MNKLDIVKNLYFDLSHLLHQYYTNWSQICLHETITTPNMIKCLNPSFNESHIIYTIWLTWIWFFLQKQVSWRTVLSMVDKLWGLLKIKKKTCYQYHHPVKFECCLIVMLNMHCVLLKLLCPKWHDTLYVISYSRWFVFAAHSIVQLHF